MNKNGTKRYVQVGLVMGRERGNRTFSATQIIMAILGREIPFGHEVHHINHNPWDNSEKNLEIVTPTRNMQLQEQRPKRTKASGLPIGVFYDRTSFSCKITRNGKEIHLGNFRTIEEAVEERRLRLLEIEAGTYAKKNQGRNFSRPSKNRIRRETRPLPTQEYLREALDFDGSTGSFSWKKRPLSHFNGVRGMNISNSSYAGKPAGTIVDRTDFDGTLKQYVLIGVGLSKFYAHRLVYAWLGKTIPDGMQVDHINGVGTDNRPENLRLVTNQRNNFNSKRRVKTLAPGLPRGIQFMLNGTFLATLKVNGVGHDCGTHSSVEAALESRRKKAEELGIRDWVE